MQNKIEINYNFLSLLGYIFMITVFPKANSIAWIFFIVLPAAIKIRKNGYKKTGFEWPIIIFLIAVLISFIGTPPQYIKIGFKELEKPLKFLSLAILVPQIFSKIEEVDEKKITYLFLGIGIIYSILVYFGSKGIYLNYDYGHAERLTGGYQISSYSGILMILNLYYFRDLYCSKKYIEKIIFLITLVLLVLTNSRGAWLGALIAYLIYFLIEQRKNLLKILISIIALSYIFYNINSPTLTNYKRRLISITNTKNDGSNLGRLDMWKKSIPVIKENPINGIGYRTGGRDIQDYFNPSKIGIVHFHNMIIDIFTGAGILGLLSYLYLYLKNILTILSFKNYRVLYPLIGVFVYDNFEPLWIRGYAYNLLFVLLSLLYIANQKERGK
ncbi:MAG: O-antigen ligase family protein [Cetobacterium sp.]